MEGTRTVTVLSSGSVEPSQIVDVEYLESRLGNLGTGSGTGIETTTITCAPLHIRVSPNTLTSLGYDPADENEVKVFAKRAGCKYIGDIPVMEASAYDAILSKALSYLRTEADEPLLPSGEQSGIIIYKNNKIILNEISSYDNETNGYIYTASTLQFILQGEYDYLAYVDSTGGSTYKHLLEEGDIDPTTQNPFYGDALVTKEFILGRLAQYFNTYVISVNIPESWRKVEYIHLRVFNGENVIDTLNAIDTSGTYAIDTAKFIHNYGANKDNLNFVFYFNETYDDPNENDPIYFTLTYTDAIGKIVNPETNALTAFDITKVVHETVSYKHCLSVFASIVLYYNHRMAYEVLYLQTYINQGCGNPVSGNVFTLNETFTPPDPLKYLSSEGMYADIWSNGDTTQLTPEGTDLTEYTLTKNIHSPILELLI